MFKGNRSCINAGRKTINIFSKALAPRDWGLSIYEKEYMAVLAAVDRWRHYLQGGHFIMRTDHHSLKYLLERKITTSLQQKGLTKLLGLNYEVQYKKGTKNIVADALSRREVEDSRLSAFTTIEPTWMQEIVQSYQDDPTVAQLTIELTTVPGSKHHYTLQ